jgi:UDP-N-acetylmuramyl tripeptide synthase
MVLNGGTLHWADVPMTYDGTARHNVENAMAAALAAQSTGVPFAAIRDGLGSFHPTASESFGRMNRFTLPNGATALVDFGHNPHGIAQVGKTTARWPANRRILLVGQAGDRTDQDLSDLTEVIADLNPDEVVLKHMDKYLRGRPSGEVVERLHRGLVEAGYPAAQLREVPDEQTGVSSMIDASRAGDLLILLIHASPADAYAALTASGATPS